LNLELEALKAVSKGALRREAFRRAFAPEGDALIQGFVGNGFIEDKGDELRVTVAGVRRLFALEGLDENKLLDQWRQAGGA
jgi:hypothetical protein